MNKSRLKYYSAIKENKHMTTWMNLKGVMLSDNSQSQKVIFCMIPFIEHSGIHKLTETRNRPMIVKD